MSAAGFGFSPNLPTRDPHRHQESQCLDQFQIFAKHRQIMSDAKDICLISAVVNFQTWSRKKNIVSLMDRYKAWDFARNENSHPAAKSLTNVEYTIIVCYNIYFNIMYISAIWIYWACVSSGKLVFVFGDSSNLFISITKVLLLRGPLLDSCLSQNNHAIEATSKSFESWRPQGTYKIIK